VWRSLRFNFFLIALSELLIHNGGAVRPYAGFWQRIKAFVFDYFIILGYLIAITVLGLLLRQFAGGFEWLFADRVRAQATGILILTLPVSLYFALGDASAKQGTWGKQRVGLKVTDKNGSQIDIGRSLVRTLLKFIPWELSHTLLWEIAFANGTPSVLINYGYAIVYLLIGLNIVSVFMTKTKQSLYDLLTGTFVEQ
jgi:uncharacterized RDD family membrane protein YckC